MLVTMSQLIKESFKRLYPEKYEGRYDFSLKYSGKFKGYNANVHYTKERYTFNLSREWERIDNEIKIGLIQSLMNKAFRTKIKTTNIDLYEIFLKNAHIGVVKDKIEPFLKESFERVNDNYFAGMITMPNLVFGTHSTTKL
jgi:hypothetical protein